MKVSNPKGQMITIRRRWYPWPDLFRTEWAEENLPTNRLVLVLQNQLGDRIIAAFLGLLIVLAFTVGGFALALTLILALLIITAIKYLGFPWSIEVLHKGTVVDSETVNGFSDTSRYIEKLSSLYEAGSLKLPSDSQEPEPIPYEPPTVRGTNLPPGMEDITESKLPVPGLEDERKPAANAPAFVGFETPLRKAVRLMEEEDEKIREELRRSR